MKRRPTEENRCAREMQVTAGSSDYGHMTRSHFCEREKDHAGPCQDLIVAALDSFLAADMERTK